MRISNIKEYLGGANNVVAREVIRGEQLILEGTVNDSDGDPIDITAYTISAVAEYYTAAVTITTGRGGDDSATITDFAASTKADKTLTVTKDADESTGKFTVVIPEDLADDADTGSLDAATGVLIAAVYLTYNDGGTPANIRKSRMLLIVRHAA